MTQSTLRKARRGLAQQRKAFASAAVAAATFAMQLAAPAFYNDHFDTLTRARQFLVTGQHPVIDTLDWGRPLHIYLSAVVQSLSGHTLLGEAMLTAAGISISLGAATWLAATLTNSATIGVVAALSTFWMQPRLYNYPKLLAATVGLMVAWRFLERPGAARAAAMGAVTAVAFLLRHDLVVYVGCTTVVALGLRFRTDSAGAVARHGAAYAVAAIGLVSPYVAVMTARGSLGDEGQRGVASLAQAASITLRSFDVRWEWPLYIAAPEGPSIKVRWVPDISPDDRSMAEQRLGLSSAREHEPPAAWTYTLDRFSAADLRAIVSNPLVEDTALVDRSTLRPEESWFKSISRRNAMLRARLADWLISRRNAETWLYDTFWVGCVIGAGIAYRQRARLTELEQQRLITLLTMSVLVLLFLVRHNLDSRLPDVAAPNWVLTGFAATTIWRSRWQHWWLSTAARGAVVAWIALTWVSITVLSGSEPISGTADRLVRLPGVLMQSVAELRRRPLDIWAPEGRRGGPTMARWLSECTRPDDRVVVVGYYPEIPYYAERAFAGGMLFYHAGYFSAPAFQQRIVEQMRGEPIPVVVVEGEGDMLRNDYAIVGRYLNERFALHGQSTFDGGGSFMILVDRSRSVSTEQKYRGLPCFRD